MNELTHSKAFLYPHGHVHFKAPTVSELMAFLAQFPADLPVVVTWEGTIHSLTAPEISSYDGCDVLEFNAEYDVTK